MNDDRLTDDELAQIRADATDVSRYRKRDPDLTEELHAFRSSSVEEVGEERFAGLLSEIKRLRGLVGDRGSGGGVADV